MNFVKLWKVARLEQHSFADQAVVILRCFQRLMYGHNYRKLYTVCKRGLVTTVATYKRGVEAEVEHLESV